MSMRKTLIYAVLFMMGSGALLWAEPATKPNSPSQAQPATIPQTNALPTPLPAILFQGRVREAYKAAAEIPEVLAGLTCYCGCDKSQGHRHLLDCFADDHGAG
jgi:hypothetical protein